MTPRAPVEYFEALGNIGICHHAFTQRIPGVDVSREKPEALRRLEKVHREIRRSIGLGDQPLVTAEQVHGSKVAVVESSPEADQRLAGVDALVTRQRGIALGVHVADCCATYIVDAATPAIGLVHSGRKGTELNIVGSVIEQMRTQFGSTAANLVVQLSPCVRPPHYETDFAATIVEQCREQGFRQIHDSGICTACNLDDYYSYRAEKGKTGRMLALLALR